MNCDNIFGDSLIEPTPLSDAIHNRHSRIQQLKQRGFLHLSEQLLKQDKLAFGVAQKRRPGPCTEKRRKKRRRNVGFASRVIIHFSPYAFEEVGSRCWYTRADMVNFKSDRKNIFKLLNSGKLILNQAKQVVNDEYRGLEAFFSTSCNRNLQLKRSQAIKSVLQEQSRQRQGGVVDAEAIRQVSRSQTKWARDRGERFGKEDAEQVVSSKPTQNIFMSNPGSRHVHRVTPLHELTIRS